METAFFEEHDTMTPDVAKVLASLPEPARGYLVGLIGITLSEVPDLSEEGGPAAWIGNEWQLIRTAMGGGA